MVQKARPERLGGEKSAGGRWKPLLRGMVHEQVHELQVRQNSWIDTCDLEEVLQRLKRIGVKESEQSKSRQHVDAKILLGNTADNQEAILCLHRREMFSGCEGRPCFGNMPRHSVDADFGRATPTGRRVETEPIKWSVLCLGLCHRRPH